MLEKYQAMLEEFKNRKEQEPFQFSADTVEEYFKQQDRNKFLKTKVHTPEQLERTNKFEDNLKIIFSKICVPQIEETADTTSNSF